VYSDVGSGATHAVGLCLERLSLSILIKCAFLPHIPLAFVFRPVQGGFRVFQR
jgi:hypothetical protein